MALSPDPSDIEFAHVLFTDLVGFSRMAVDEQTQRVRELYDLLHATRDYKEADRAGKLILCPSGDGGALVFFTSPEAPVRAALEVYRAVQSRPWLLLRMGIHTGPVLRVPDVKGDPSVAGNGINLARRVMDAAGEGEIFLSGAVADVLAHSRRWRDALQDEGPRQVKHGETLHLYRLNPEAVRYPDPGRESLEVTQYGSEGRRLVESGSKGGLVETRPSTGARESALPVLGQRIALLYKRNAQPDERLLDFLYGKLSERGHRVFIDRNLKVGVEWAKEIDRQVREADAVIILLSAASVTSEMLEFEVRSAYEEQQEKGTPLLLPVRVCYPEPLPEALGTILNPLQYAVWHGPGDSDRLLDELLQALESPEDREAAPPGPPVDRDSPRPNDPPPGDLGTKVPLGGAVPLGSRYYVERETDAQFMKAVARQESLILVKGARQMGKTSLLARGLDHARRRGSRVFFTDFQKLTSDELETQEAFYQALVQQIADDLELDVNPRDRWVADRSPNVNFERFILREVLGKSSDPVLWCLDEVDRLFTTRFGSDVFGLFRSWHNERAINPTKPWGRLTMAIAYATEAHLFIRDLNQSPFNVGLPLALADFTSEQVQDLNGRHGAPLKSAAEVARFFRLVNGHPYLVQRGLYELGQRGQGIAAFEAEADRDTGPFGDHLRRLLVTLSRDEKLREVMAGVLLGQGCPGQESFYRLRSGGAVAGEIPQEARPRCQLYATYLERHLL